MHSAGWLGTTNVQSKGSVEGRYHNVEVASEIKLHVLAKDGT